MVSFDFEEVLISLITGCSKNREVERCGSESPEKWNRMEL